MASSSKYLEPFENLGVAEYINEMISHDKTNALTDVCKGVLVALGAPVDLEERWTGARGDILSKWMYKLKFSVLLLFKKT